METDYGYDALNDLLSVTQWGGASGSSGARTRAFSYDSLSRLLNACNPETIPSGSSCSASGPWGASYSYDGDGNVLTKTDARNITTTSTYDALNRLTQKSYSDGVTPTSLFVYDVENITFGTPNFPTQRFTTSNVVGRLSVTCVVVSAVCQSMTAYSYDPMGRIIETLSNTPSFPTTGTVYAVSATYDLAGDRTSLTNSTGRTFNYTYDPAGRLQTASNTVSLNGGDGLQSGQRSYIVVVELHQRQFEPFDQRAKCRGGSIRMRVGVRWLRQPPQSGHVARGQALRRGGRSIRQRQPNAEFLAYQMARLSGSIR
jgi:YD repeat-containing protein